MGGKVWSKDEETVFWKELIPHSPKRLGEDRVRNKERSWYWVANQMTIIMGTKARREYTHLGVCEYLYISMLSIQRRIGLDRKSMEY